MIIEDIPRRNARRYPDKTAMIFEDTKYTFKELNDRINSLANALADMDLSKGDRLGMIADNCSQYIDVFWTAAKTGMAMSVLNPALPKSDLSYLINNAGARAVVFSENYRDLIESLRPKLKDTKEYIVIGTPGRGAKSYEELISSYSPLEPEVEIDDDDLLYLANTSGTTGLPKQIMVTYRSLLVVMLDDLHAYDMSEKDVGLYAAPWSWGFMVARLSIPCFYMGCPVVIPREFTPQCILQAIEREGVTNMNTSTGFVRQLIEYPDVDKYDHSSLRYIVTAGMPLPPEAWRRAIEIFGNIFVTYYGLAEMGHISSLSSKEFVFEGPPEKVNRLRSCGKEAMNVEVRVIDEWGNDVQPGQLGELIAKGDEMMQGYRNAPKATEEAIKQGYLYTGDLATTDEEGYIYLAGRKKDAIITQGKMLLPSEIEEVIYRHPGVSEVAVIGVPDEKLGQAVKAVVVAKEGKITEEEIIELCRQNLPSHAVPKSIDFVESLPKTPSGKVVRYALSEKYTQPS